MNFLLQSNKKADCRVAGLAEMLTTVKVAALSSSTRALHSIFFL